ncbi:ABC transporter permease [Actinophytocola sp.]|uniref:ABC transporter permease n=1 Tax=Actinophytocola sp. TaxID=1872138 RepID=UPI002ED44891
MMLALSVVELKLLLRKKLTAFSAIVVPLALVAMTLFGKPPPNAAEWANVLSSQFMLLLALSVFMVSLMVFTARRQSLVLKRLRTSALSDGQILLGVLGPVMVVGLAQSAAYFAACLLADAPAPANPLLVVFGVLLGVVVATALGVATACLSRSVEATQITSVPVVMAGVAGIFLSGMASPALAAVGVAMPLMGPADLVAKGWSSAGAMVGDVPVVPLDIASAVLWLAVAGVVFSRLFRWEPRR